MKDLIKKVLQEETSSKHNLITMIKKFGVESVIKMVGGFNTFRNILGDDDLLLIIYGYLDFKYTPDYGWEDYELYDEEISNHGIYKFTVNDEWSYQFTEYGNGGTLLYLFSDTYDDLDNIFGGDGKWLDIFKKWFEKHTGLKVDMID